MNIDTSKLKPLHGYLEGAADAVDPEDAAKAIQYKKEVTRNFNNVTVDQIDFRIGGSQFFVTRKYDGEMNVLFFDGDQAVIINRSGRVRMGLPCVEDARQALIAAGVTQAVIPAELYVDETDGRTRVFDVLEALADEKKIATLRLAFFDLLELNGENFKPTSYADTLTAIEGIISTATQSSVVTYTQCDSTSQVKQTYTEWVEDAGAEGLVIRTELPLVHKVKPRHTIDVVVVGYSEGTGDQAGQIRTLLVAMMPAEGEYQIIGRTGNGFSEDLKKELLTRLEKLAVESHYIETDSNHVAFRMIRPEVVIELMINDVLIETSSGEISNPILVLDKDKYILKGRTSGISVVYPIYQRIRDDKKAVVEDVRLTQINDFSYVDPSAAIESTSLAKSELLRREVYTKEVGGKLMVAKFVVWQTNKPAPDYPRYVFHYTNFSSDRKDPLQREVAISDDETQIMELCNASIEANIKRGWNPVN